jgi:predicted flap endonuclease-1-like 5' DNA nuclease
MPFNDLKRIKGVGPVIENHFHAAGIKTFTQLGNLSPAQIAKLIPGRSAARIARENWIGQARKLASRTELTLSKRVGSANIAKKSTADDFELIEGICPEVARSLNAAGIFTYAQLAELSLEQLTNLVPGLSAKRETCQSWLTQAHHFASNRVMAKRRKKTTHLKGRHNSLIVELHLNENNSVQYTRVTHSRCDVRESWPGWEESRLIDFLVRHVGLEVHKPELAASPDSSSSAVLPVAPTVVAAPDATPLPERSSPAEPASPSITLGDAPSSLELETDFGGLLRICKLITTPIGSDISHNSVHTGEIFNCRVVMDFAEAKISPGVPLSYTATVWAKKLGDKSRQIAGERQGVIVPNEKPSCTVEVVLTSQGTYRLEALVTLTQPGDNILLPSRLLAMQRGGWLQVY